VRRHAATAAPDRRAVWQGVALPACEGLYRYARGDYDRAWQWLAGSVPRIAEVGGSHAQRDLFEQILVDAAVKSGRLISAQQMLELRRKMDAGGVPVNRALAAVYQQLNLPALAQQSLRRADQTRSRHAR
jgi:hypothetical protein